MSDTIERLCHEYVAWNIQQGLNLGSADEHWHDPALTHEERVWVREFSRRWDVAVDAERVQAEVEAEAQRDIERNAQVAEPLRSIVNAFSPAVRP